MCAPPLKLFALLALSSAHSVGLAQVPAQDTVPLPLPALRVCADPDNLPYSSQDKGGFELEIARVLADEMKVAMEVHCFPLQRGFVRKTAGMCEVFIGVPAGYERVQTTRSYYRSTYVAVGRLPRQGIQFDCVTLCHLRIGVQLPGDDQAATPPGHALARAGVIQNVRGYPVMGTGHSTDRMLTDLRQGNLDLAFAWGPQAGWLAAQEPSLPMAVLRTPHGGPSFEFSIAVGVRRGHEDLRRQLDVALQARRTDIEAVLDRWKVPRLPLGGGER